MLELENDERPFKEIWCDYLATMAQASWQEVSDEPLSFDFAAAESIDESHHGGVWAILVDGERVGYATWVISRHMFVDKQVCTILSLYVEPEHRNNINVRKIIKLIRAKLKGRADYYVISSNVGKSLCDRVWMREV